MPNKVGDTKRRTKKDKKKWKKKVYGSYTNKHIRLTIEQSTKNK
tara:strand:- start:45 stop:176 length:132 start_codon:yes stop_codon:yes gene_type:complete